MQQSLSGRKAQKRKAEYRCRSCGAEFSLKPSPNRFVTVKCKYCGSEDVEIL